MNLADPITLIYVSEITRNKMMNSVVSTNNAMFTPCEVFLCVIMASFLFFGSY